MYNIFYILWFSGKSVFVVELLIEMTNANGNEVIFIATTRSVPIPPSVHQPDSLLLPSEPE